MVAVTSAKLGGGSAAPVIVQLKGFASEDRIAGAAACNLSYQKAADARIMAECARVAKDVVFVAADDSQAVVTAEMRELISEALDLLADTEG
jgi:hypothetical protein